MNIAFCFRNEDHVEEGLLKNVLWEFDLRDMESVVSLMENTGTESSH